MAIPTCQENHGDGNNNNKSEEDEEIICTHLPLHPPPSDPSGDGHDENGGVETGLKTVGVAGVTGGVAAVAVPTAATAGLTAAGFTSGGIAAGSIAAASQAAIGNVAAGSAFATLQSIGATGGFAILGPVGLVAGVVVGASVGGVFLYKALKRKRNKRNGARSSGSQSFARSVNPSEPIRGVTVCEECWKKMQEMKLKSFQRK